MEKARAKCAAAAAPPPADALGKVFVLHQDVQIFVPRRAGSKDGSWVEGVFKHQYTPSCWEGGIIGGKRIRFRVKYTVGGTKDIVDMAWVRHKIAPAY